MKTIIGKKVTDLLIMCSDIHGNEEADTIVITVEDGTKIIFVADSVTVGGEEVPVITHYYEGECGVS